MVRSVTSIAGTDGEGTTIRRYRAEDYGSEP